MSDRHSAAITSVSYLPAAKVVISACVDGSMRFFDSAANVFSLVEPSRSKHVRIWPGYYDAMRPETTLTNTPFCNVLTIASAEPFQVHIL